MNVAVVSMLPVVMNTLCCEVPFCFNTMPRVVPDQREKFENDEFFRKLSRESEVRFTGHKDRPQVERQQKFLEDCRAGHAHVAFTNSGTNFQLSFLCNPWSTHNDDRRITPEYVDFNKESGKVHLKSRFIMNGVCVVWRGWMDLQRLDGVGKLEFDDERAQVEDSILRDQIEQYNHRIREFEERQRLYQDDRERQAEAEAEVVQTLLRFTEGECSGDGASAHAGSGADANTSTRSGANGTDGAYMM